MPYPQVDTTRHQYRVKRWLQVFFGCLALVLLCGGVLLMRSALVDRTASGLAIPAAVMLAGAAYLLALILRSRLVIEGTRLEVHGVFRVKAADLADIEGYRTIATRYGSFRRISLKEGCGRININNYFASDEDFRAWFQQVPDLDLRDRDALLREIEQSDTLGSTPEERRGALSRAKRGNIALIVLSCSAAAGLNLGPAAALPISALVLALLPAALFLLLQREPLLYAFGRRKADPRADLLFSFVVACFGLVLFADKVTLVALGPLLTLIVPLFLAVIAAFARSAWTSRSRAGLLFALVVFAAMYSYGASIAADSLPDHSKPSIYSVPVVGKHITQGRSTTYYLSLAPWGPKESVDDFNVSETTYRETPVGGQVCLALHRGSVHAAWYQAVDCPPAQAALNP